MNIGICSVYFDRGSGVICQQIKQAIKWHTDHEIALLARMSIADNSKKIKFWDDYFHNNVLLFPTYDIDEESFEQWIKANNLSVVIFVEEQHGKKNLVDVCNKLSVKSINYVVWEFINPSLLDFYRKFTHIVCPTKCTFNKLKNDLLLDNSVYVPWGVDLDLYQWQEPVPKQKPLLFFPAGFGGVADRKNEKAVIDAFSYVAPRDRMTLHIHTQQEKQARQAQNVIKTSGTVDHNQLINYYREADIIVLPSRWEGNGLPFMEASSIGRPVITVDSPPMNEKVINNINGLLCKVKEMRDVQGIFVKSAEVDIWDFAEKMIMLEDRDLLYSMQLSSIKFAEENFNWFENSKKLIDLL